jgi:hypothetical protein
MKIFGVVFTLLLVACPTSLVAHETIMTAYCKQGTCWHTRVRNVEPIQIGKLGVLRRYEAAVAERKCKVDETMDNAECRKVPPPLDQFRYGRSFAFCSLSNPATFGTFTDSAGSGGYLGNFLDIAGTIPEYQVSATLEYLVVCHGWEPVQFDDEFARNIAALGYKPRESASSQRKFESEADVLKFVGGQTAAGEPPSPSLKALEGKWHSGSAQVCKGNPGETEGLLTFRGTHFIGLENDCTIRNSKANGRFLAIQMVCNGEGMQAREAELIQFMSDREIKRIIMDGKKQHSFVHTRCP